MKLSEYFSKQHVIRDADIKNTYYTTSRLPQSVTFALDLKNIQLACENPNIAAIITSKECVTLIDENKGIVISDNPKKEFFELHNYMFEKGIMQLSYVWGIDNSAKIDKTAIIGKKVFIGRNVVIDKKAIIEDFSIIEEGTYIGPNAVIGARGMHNTFVNGELINVEDSGGVKIGKGCEILANAVIQKNYFCNYTQIGNFNKISVNVIIGHGSLIGNGNLIAGAVAMAGFCTVGNETWIGPSTTIAHGIKIGDKSSIKLGSVVVVDVERNSIVSGNFAFKHSKHLKQFIKNNRP